MIRTPSWLLSAELKQTWKDAAGPVADAALADFKTWPLYEQVGETWPEAPPRFVRAMSVASVEKGLKSGVTAKLESEANSGLRSMYHNLSGLLNARNQHFSHDTWTPYQIVVWKTTETAVKSLAKRIKMQGLSNNGFWLYPPNTHLWQHVWEQLHPNAIEAPFQEHFLTIFRAGHVPAGLQGDDWKSCQVLYF